MVGLIVLGRPVIQLMFERGKFGPDSTVAVYQSLQFWAMALVAHCLIEVANRYFYAQKDTFTPLITAMCGMLLNLTFALALYQRLDAGGLALSNGLAVSLDLIILLIISYRQSGLADFRALGLTLAQTLFAAIIMGGLIMGLLSFISTWPLFAQISVGGLLGLISYGLVIWLMGMEEVRGLWGYIEVLFKSHS
jgi:putative peptidoglycan lipid II flippase